MGKKEIEELKFLFGILYGVGEKIKNQTGLDLLESLKRRGLLTPGNFDVFKEGLCAIMVRKRMLVGLISVDFRNFRLRSMF